jgi:hypothetical protein
MFTRDLPLGIMPVLRRNDPDYQVTLDPGGDEAVEWLLEFLDVGQYTRHELAAALEDFMETAARYIGYQGEVFFEIVDVSDGKQRFQLAPMALGRVIRGPGGYYQPVPKADRKEIGKRFVRIPKDRVWHLKLPRSLGTPRQHRRMLRALGERSDPMPAFQLESMDLGRSVGYDFSAHRRACDISVERATRRWGTIPSLWRVEGTTEYFLFSRRLSWKRAQAELREHALAELNAVLTRVDFPHSVSISGLPAPSEIETMIQRLGTGDVTVGEAMDIEKS